MDLGDWLDKDGNHQLPPSLYAHAASHIKTLNLITRHIESRLALVSCSVKCGSSEGLRLLKLSHKKPLLPTDPLECSLWGKSAATWEVWALWDHHSVWKPKLASLRGHTGREMPDQTLALPGPGAKYLSQWTFNDASPSYHLSASKGENKQESASWVLSAQNHAAC